jgi:uncharacterized protein YkwD
MEPEKFGFLRRIIIPWKKISDVFSVALSIAILCGIVYSTYIFGYNSGHSLGYQKGSLDVINQIELQTPEPTTSSTEPPSPTSVPTPVPVKKEVIQPRSVGWGGPELWDEVNKKRVSYGVGQLQKSDELCTLASIRLNELLALGRLDGHEGFSNMSERRPDLKWIFDKYAIAEFLVAGASSAQEAVSLWDNTLGHKKLLTGGEYVW